MFSNPQNKSTSVYGPMHFAAASTDSSGTGTTSDTQVFMQLDLVPSTSNPEVVHDNTKSKNSYEMA
jgi:hypothetical protein